MDFCGTKTAKSSGCVRWLEFRTSLINITLFWIQASITTFEKREPKLSPINAIGSCMVLAFGKNILRNPFSKVFKSSHALVVQPYTVPRGLPSTQLLNILSSTYYHWERVRSTCATAKHHANQLLGMFHFFSAMSYDNLVYREYGVVLQEKEEKDIAGYHLKMYNTFHLTHLPLSKFE